MSDSSSSTPLTSSIEELIAQCEALRKQNAAMRSVLELLDQLGGLGFDKHRWIRDALQPDVGARYLSPEQVKPLVDALALIDKHSSDGHSGWSLEGLEALRAVTDAIKHAQALGLIDTPS